MDECVSHRQIVLKQSSVTDKSNKGDLSWANGYFVCSVGNVSEKILKEHIENQG